MKKLDIDFFIGIDAGLNDNNGIATRRAGEKQILRVASLTFFQLLNDLKIYSKSYKVGVVIENADMDSNVFGGWEDFCRVLRANLKNPLSAAVKSSFSKWLKRAQDVGKNKATAHLIIQFCKAQGIYFVEIRPSERAKLPKNCKIPEAFRMPTKTTKEQFKRITGYSDRSNEHGRDAGTLIGWREMTVPKFGLLHFKQNIKR